MGAGPGKPILDSLSCPRGGEVGLTSPHWTGPMGCPRREVVFGPPPPPPRPPNNFVTIESELIFYCGTSKNRKNVKKNAILANISGRKTPHCRYIGWEKKKKNLGRRWPKWRRVDGHTWQVALTLGRRQPTTGDALAGLAWHGTTRLEGPGQWWPDLTRQVAPLLAGRSTRPVRRHGVSRGATHRGTSARRNGVSVRGGTDFGRPEPSAGWFGVPRDGNNFVTIESELIFYCGASIC